MKNFLQSYRGVLVVVLAIGLFGFAAARYDIYRLRPNPKPGEIIGEKNGFWSAISFPDYFTRSLGYTESDEASGLLYVEYNTDSAKYVSALKSFSYLTLGGASGSVSNFTTNSKGEYPNTITIDNDLLPYAKIDNDTTGIVVNTCCWNNGSFRLVFSRADTLLKSTLVTGYIRYGGIKTAAIYE